MAGGVIFCNKNAFVTATSVFNDFSLGTNDFHLQAQVGHTYGNPESVGRRRMLNFFKTPKMRPLLSILMWLVYTFSTFLSGVELAYTNESLFVSNRNFPSEKYPFMAAVMFRKADTTRNQWMVVAGGVIWNYKHILTSGSIFSRLALADKDYLQVQVGHTYDNNGRFDDFIWDSRPSTVIIHEDYTKNVNANLALFSTSNSNFDTDKPNTKCVCQPEPAKNYFTDRCLMFGWKFKEPKGYPTALCAFEVTIVENRSSDEVVVVRLNDVKDDSKCAHEGSPLVCPIHQHSDKYTLVGIHQGITKKHGFHLHTRVYKYLHWIERQCGEPLTPTVSPVDPVTGGSKVTILVTDTTASSASSIGFLFAIVFVLIATSIHFI